MANGKFQPSNKKKASQNSDPAGMKDRVTGWVKNTTQAKAAAERRGTWDGWWKKTSMLRKEEGYRPATESGTLAAIFYVTELFLQPSCPFPPSHLTCKNTISSSCFKWGYDTLVFVSNAADGTLGISCVGFQPEEGKRVDTEQQMGLPLVIFLHPSYLASLTCTDFIKGLPFTLDSSWVWLSNGEPQQKSPENKESKVQESALLVPSWISRSLYIICVLSGSLIYSFHKYLWSACKSH